MSYSGLDNVIPLMSSSFEDVCAPPELLTLDVGSEPTLEVGPALAAPDEVALLSDVVVVPDAEDEPPVLLEPVVEVAPDADGVPGEEVPPVEDELLDDEVEPDASGAA